MSQFILSSFTLAPLIHHTRCYYQFHLLVSDLLTHPTLLKTLHFFNLLTAVISYMVPRMKSCPETPVCQLDKSRLFWSHQKSTLDHCPSSSQHPELSRRDFEYMPTSGSEIFSQFAFSILFPISVHNVPYI